MLGPKSTKGKSSANPTRPTAIEAGDESSSSCSDIYVSNNHGKSDSNDSNGEKSDAEDEDDFEVTRMTEGEARRMFEVEVMSSIFNIHPTLCADSIFRCLRMWLLFSIMTTTL